MMWCWGIVIPIEHLSVQIETYAEEWRNIDARGRKTNDFFAE